MVALFDNAENPGLLIEIIALPDHLLSVIQNMQNIQRFRLLNILKAAAGTPPLVRLREGSR